MLFPNPYRQRDPFALMRSAMRDLDRSSAPAASRPVFPAVNVWEGDEALAITAELPGVEPSDIEITANGDVLTIAGERKPPELPEGAAWHRRERGHGTFSRAVRLPFAAADDGVEARLQDGVLRVVVRRPDETKPRKIEIKAA